LNHKDENKSDQTCEDYDSDHDKPPFCADESTSTRIADGLNLSALIVADLPVLGGFASEKAKARLGIKRCGCNPAAAGFENNH
jgi:hypothetical protein